MPHFRLLLASAAMVSLGACETGLIGETEPAIAPTPPPMEAAEPASTDTAQTEAEAAEQVPEASDAPDELAAPAQADVEHAEIRLATILAAQPEAVKARYGARHPAATLDFFRIEPGMTIVEALPGGGWYTKILMPYLGPEGELIGALYPDNIWVRILPPNMQDGLDEFIARQSEWAQGTADWGIEDAAPVSQFKMTEAPDALAGTVDAVLFIRALHNLRRVEGELGHFTTTIAEAYELLKPGGIVGVVQHRAPENAGDDWADGNAGYLKQSDVIAAFEQAGFVLEATSEVNANPKDQPGEDDIVWRLPPSFGTTEEGTPERAALAEIGESDRMTLRFRKPE